MQIERDADLVRALGPLGLAASNILPVPRRLCSSSDPNAAGCDSRLRGACHSLLAHWIKRGARYALSPRVRGIVHRYLRCGVVARGQGWRVGECAAQFPLARTSDGPGVGTMLLFIALASPADLFALVGGSAAVYLLPNWFLARSAS